MTVYLILVVLIVIILFLLIANKKSNSTDSCFSYTQVDTLFTPAERSFYGVLRQVIGTEAEVFAKVRVADVLMPEKGQGRSGWQTAFNKISRKHFDFLVCNRDDLSILCAVELDDKSHQKKSRKERDAFLSSACLSAGVPLVNVRAQASYNVSEINTLLAEYVLGLSDSSRVAVGVSEPEPGNVDIKVCPKCSTEMVERISKKGVHAGKTFLACRAYPKCKHIEQIG